MNKKLAIFIGVEVALIVTAILIALATRGSNDFSGLAILYPIFVMFFVGIVGLLGLVYRLIRNSRAGKQGRLNRVKEAALLLVVGLPVLFVVDSNAGSVIGWFAKIYLLTLLVKILVANRDNAVDKLFDLVLIALPAILIMYAATIDDSNLLIWSSVLGGLLIYVEVKALKSPAS